MEDSVKKRIIVATLSVTGLAGIAAFEGFKENAYVPVPGDKITIGYGNTRYQDGSPIRMGDTITRERAMYLLKGTLNIYENGFKRCAPYPVFQYEADAYISLIYNVGPANFCKSSIPRKLSEGRYREACETILQFNKFNGAVLKGLDNRRRMEFNTCIGANEVNDIKRAAGMNVPPLQKATDKISEKTK